MAKYVEITLTEVLEIPDSWDIVEDDEGNIALQTQNDEFLDFETVILYADAKNLDEQEEAKWKSCIDDESLDMLEQKGLKHLRSELDIFELEEDELEEQLKEEVN
jgi:hypothetical protein